MADSQQLDLFSYLPLMLVIKIISSLTFSQAYNLCLLRPDWLEAQLWRNCCSIDLHEQSHLSRVTMRRELHLGRVLRARKIKDIDRVNFWRLAGRVIPLVDRDQNLNRFSLQISFTSNSTHLVDTWLSIVLSKHIKEITLDFADRDTIVPIETDFYEVPNFFFQGHEWITILRLLSCVIPNERHFRGFTHLTTLVLQGIRFKGINVNDSFLGCAFLEDLFIVECFGILKMEIGLEMRRLSRLVVQNCEAIGEGIELIHAQQLVHFEYQGALIRFNFEGTCFLDSVILDFVDTSYPYPYLEIDDYFSRIFYPKYFTITTPALKITPAEYMYVAPPIVLLNVDRLTIKTSMGKIEMAAILSLLKGAKYMRYLNFVPFTISADMEDVHHDMYQYYHLPEAFWHPTDNAVMPLLEKVEFGGFGGREFEFKVLSFILIKCSKNLRKVVLKPRRGMDLHQVASSYQFRALKEEHIIGFSRVIFEWRYR